MTNGLRGDGRSGDIGRMAFWVAQIEMKREALAIYCLQLAEYEVYAPHVRDGRDGHRGVVPLFPGYLFLAASPRGWWQARWSPGVRCLILSGEEPAHVPDRTIDELRDREDRNGLVRLPKPPSRLNGGALFQRGDKVRIKDGPLRGLTALVADMRPHERIAVLLTMLGALQRVELAAADVARA